MVYYTCLRRFSDTYVLTKKSEGAAGTGGGQENRKRVLAAFCPESASESINWTPLVARPGNIALFPTSVVLVQSLLPDEG